MPGALAEFDTGPAGNETAVQQSQFEKGKRTKKGSATVEAAYLRTATEGSRPVGPYLGAPATQGVIDEGLQERQEGLTRLLSLKHSQSVLTTASVDTLDAGRPETVDQLSRQPPRHAMCLAADALGRGGGAA